jgi:hypothetical protein
LSIVRQKFYCFSQNAPPHERLRISALDVIDVVDGRRRRRQGDVRQGVGASANDDAVARNCDNDDDDDDDDRIIVVRRRDAAAATVAADILIILLSFSWISQGRSYILNILTILYCIVLTDCPLLKNC